MIIFKYLVNVNTDNHLWLPKGAKILSVQEQGAGYMQCWVLHDDFPEGCEYETRIVYVIGTGIEINEGRNPINDRLTYINTCVTVSGFVWHSFERKVW